MMLRDCIVYGINDAFIQCRLQSKKDLTFKTTLDLAQVMESAAKNCKELSSWPSSEGLLEQTYQAHTKQIILQYVR